MTNKGIQELIDRREWTAAIACLTSKKITLQFASVNDIQSFRQTAYTKSKGNITVSPDYENLTCYVERND